MASRLFCAAHAFLGADCPPASAAPGRPGAFDNLLLPIRHVPISLPSWPGVTGEGTEANVKVEQSLARSDGTGGACWDSSVVLAAFLVGRFGAPGTPAAGQLRADPWNVAGCTVLELGAGCAALPSVACACELGAALVIATDAGSTCALAAQNMASPDFKGPLGESAACLGKILVAPLVWNEAGGSWGQARASGNDGDNSALHDAPSPGASTPLTCVYVAGRQVTPRARFRSSKAALKLAEAKEARARRLSAALAAAASEEATAEETWSKDDAAMANARAEAAGEAATVSLALRGLPCEQDRRLLQLLEPAEAAKRDPSRPTCEAPLIIGMRGPCDAPGALSGLACAPEPPPPSLQSVADAAKRSSIVLASDVFHDPRAHTAFWVTAVRHLAPGGVCIAAFRRRLPEAENCMLSSLAPTLGLQLVCAISAKQMLMSCQDRSARSDSPAEESGTVSLGPCDTAPESLVAPPWGCRDIPAVAPDSALLRSGIVRMLSEVADLSRIWVVCLKLTLHDAPERVDPASVASLPVAA
uniref:Calmodulin-lysine N-methyltransferase n=1 Tax=Cafeteria roenbergensis TaxID=33653 RepID=A0A7S0K073_CAFRO